MSGLESLAGTQLKGVGVKKMGRGANEFEFSVRQLFPAVIGEFLDQAILAGHDFWKVEGHSIGSDAPGFRVGCAMHDLSSKQQGFGWHATTKNTKAANFLSAFDHHRAKACSRSCASGRIAAAA